MFSRAATRFHLGKSSCSCSYSAHRASAFSPTSIRAGFWRPSSSSSCSFSGDRSFRGPRVSAGAKAKGKASSFGWAVESDMTETMSAESKPTRAVHKSRWRELNVAGAENHKASGPVVYLCDRDQRARDNWALLHALHVAETKGKAVVVLFVLTESQLRLGHRHSLFMIKGLQEMQKHLAALNVPFHLVLGEPAAVVADVIAAWDAAALVTDFSPLREARQWRDSVAGSIQIPFHEVDAHNIVPIWITSNKQEYAARTIRSKIHRNIPQYLRAIPKPRKQDFDFSNTKGSFGEPNAVAWDDLVALAREKGQSDVPEVSWCEPGEEAALRALKGEDNSFLTKMRMNKYDELRNNPNKPAALSNLSPYLHFGQLSAQRCAIEAIGFKKNNPSSNKSVDNYLEELVVRRELSDNFCFYNDLYDSVKGAASWAQETLQIHSSDKREHLYDKEALEQARTHDDLWNAAQKELTSFGKMHGFMRMYWAKKILEWTASPEEALDIAIYLNDKYSLDGRDPNGYVGCMWSICGTHDQGWREREVFGKIRYMNYNGCKRKFDVDAYVQRIRREMKQNRYFNEK
ncbi:deoxyribodipyrimidine photo-lyase [Chloropicon primus]|nr:deoxyribodipyrimidine photo-lyase [Chloropicon primus]